MTVFQLDSELLLFPDPELADPDGLLAIGGDLGRNRLIAAYTYGIFPWYNDQSPILWWSPDPRCILDLADLHVPRRLRRTLRNSPFRVTLDTCFSRVIRACARAPRREGEGTWIVSDMIRAYEHLYQAGFAHSVEVWGECDGQSEALVGGLYGVSLGRAFFGESMFHRVSDASKTAVVWLSGLLRAWDFAFIDCQQTTGHMLRFGAREVPRSTFLHRLRRALDVPTRRGLWGLPDDFSPL